MQISSTLDSKFAEEMRAAINGQPGTILVAGEPSVAANRLDELLAVYERERAQFKEVATELDKFRAKKMQEDAEKAAEEAAYIDKLKAEARSGPVNRLIGSFVENYSTEIVRASGGDQTALAKTVEVNQAQFIGHYDKALESSEVRSVHLVLRHAADTIDQLRASLVEADKVKATNNRFQAVLESSAAAASQPPAASVVPPTGGGSAAAAVGQKRANDGDEVRASKRPRTDDGRDPFFDQFDSMVRASKGGPGNPTLTKEMRAFHFFKTQ